MGASNHRNVRGTCGVVGKVWQSKTERMLSGPRENPVQRIERVFLDFLENCKLFSVTEEKDHEGSGCFKSFYAILRTGFMGFWRGLYGKQFCVNYIPQRLKGSFLFVKCYPVLFPQLWKIACFVLFHFVFSEQKYFSLNLQVVARDAAVHCQGAYMLLIALMLYFLF